MATALLTPFVGTRAVELSGRRWWKRLLPLGDIRYKGRVLKFDRDYLEGLVGAFRQRAYDQVPFQLAGDENKHTNDVERYGGKITDMALRQDGLWIELDPTDRGERVLRDNPGCGVSARIVEAYDRSDGRFFPKAIQHVLATLDPRIPGLGGWQAVEAANDVEVTFDLSGEQFTGEEAAMPELTEEQKAKLARLLDLPVERLERLATLSDTDIATINGGEGLGAGDDLGELTDAEVEAIADEALRMEQEGLLDDEPGQVAASNALATEQAMAVELASAQGAEAMRQLAIINNQLDVERWENERRKLVSAGTPPYIADLAQPLLQGSGHVVDLANGSSVDAGQIVRTVLREYAKLHDTLGLGEVELGSAADEPEDAADGDREEIIKAFKAQLGIS